MKPCGFSAAKPSNIPVKNLAAGAHPILRLMRPGLFEQKVCSPWHRYVLSAALFGVLAQLVERLNGIEEVRGSNPLGSTPLPLVISKIREARPKCFVGSLFTWEGTHLVVNHRLQAW